MGGLEKPLRCLHAEGGWQGVQRALNRVCTLTKEARLALGRSAAVPAEREMEMLGETICRIILPRMNPLSLRCS